MSSLCSMSSFCIVTCAAVAKGTVDVEAVVMCVFAPREMELVLVSSVSMASQSKVEKEVVGGIGKLPGPRWEALSAIGTVAGLGVSSLRACAINVCTRAIFPSRVVRP